MVTRLRRECSLDGCTRLHYGLGLCRLHYFRWKAGKLAYDAPDSSRGRAQAFLEEALQRLPSADCVDWPFATSSSVYQYAVMGDGANTSRKVTHIVLERTDRPRPSPLHEAMHSCHRPICIAWWHLSWGTHEENMKQLTTKHN